jgi:ABC-type dipeptide/oligopeptide/nickel transport system ATPase subunit
MENEYYTEPCLKKALDKIKIRIQKHDNDTLICMDGAEGSGKSVFAMQIAHYIDPSLDLTRVCMNAEEFKQAIMRAEKNQAVIYDEAYSGLSSRASLSAVNKILVGKMMEMRQKNLFVIIVLPSFFLLDRYVALFRSRALLHVYSNKGNKGYWIGFNEKNKKLLYIFGRKLMTYSKPHIYDFKGRFYGKYVIDEQAYRKKKKEALETSHATTEYNKFMIQRDILIRNLVNEKGLSLRKSEKYLKELGFIGNLSLSRTTIGEIMHTGSESQLSGGSIL